MQANTRVYRLMAVMMAVAGLLLVMGTAAPRADAVVTWSAQTYWAPTVLQPGQQGGVSVIPGNAGDEPASGWPAVEITFPPGVTMGDYNPVTGWECIPGVDPRTVTCDSPFADGFPMFWPPEYSLIGFGGQSLPIQMTVNVAADAPLGTQELAVTLSGAGAAAPTTYAFPVTVGGAPEGFGVIDGTFQAGALDADGSVSTQAGGHPDRFETRFVTTKKFNPVADIFNTGDWAVMIEPVSGIKDVVVDLPPGFVGNPQAVPTCTLARVIEESCPPSTQVGIAEVNNIVAPPKQLYGIYNVAPPRSAPAQFAFFTDGGPVVLTPVVRSDGDWGLSVNTKDLTEANPLFAGRITIWGTPADATHDGERCAKPNSLAYACVGFDSFHDTNFEPIERYSPNVSGVLPRPFLSNPTRCDGTSEIVTMHLSPWLTPARFEVDGDPDLTDPLWESYSSETPPLTGCDALSFIPSIDVKPTKATPSGSSGLEFTLTIPQNNDVDGLATAHMRNARVTLPVGTVINPSSADGLASCSSAQIGLVSKSPVRFTKTEPSCPLESKVGTVEVDTPLLAEKLRGDVYLAGQNDHPFDSLVAMYIVLRGPGILGKLAGEVDLNEDNGQITTTVIDNPQVPFDSLTIKLKPGDRAPLTMPSTCGNHVTTAAFTSWAGHNVEISDGFTIDCPGNGDLFDPTFEAGTANPTAGASSPFHMRMTRSVGKELGRVQTTLPNGLLASPKNVAVCGDAALAALTTYRPGHPQNPAGRGTQTTPSCPVASQIGTTTVGVGSGATPFYPLIPGTQATGRVFLTGPHPGTDLPQPGKRQIAYGIGIEVPAVAGPFDLGTVLVRAAIYADPTTAELSVVSDKLPRILRGVPLNVRDVRVDIDRAGFTRNPTSCAEKQVDATISAQDGASVQRSSRFQVGDCAALGFKPRLGLRLTGRRQMKSGGHPGVRAVVRQGRNQAGIKKVQVRLPLDLALDPDNAQALCEYTEGIKDEPNCPKGSIVGRARAVSPLLKRPLSGNVYFVKNVRIDKKTGASIRTLPMLVVALRGEIAVNLRGQSSSKGGKLINTFAQVPDAPISEFRMNLKGGSSGIVVVTENARGRISLCSKKQIAEVDADAHSGKRRDFDVRMKTACKTKRAKR